MIPCTPDRSAHATRPAVPASTPLRARNPTLRRLGAARVWTLARIGNISIQHDLTGHKSEPVRSFRVPGRRREPAPTQPRRSVKRVQRVEDSLAQVWGAEPQRTLRGKRHKANMITQKRTHAAPPPSPASPRAPVGIATKNAQARSEPGNPDNRTGDPRTRYRRSRPMAE